MIGAQRQQKSGYDAVPLRADDAPELIKSPLHAENLPCLPQQPHTVQAIAQPHPEVHIPLLLRPLLTWLIPLIKIAASGKVAECDIWDSPVDASVQVRNWRFLDILTTNNACV